MIAQIIGYIIAGAMLVVLATILLAAIANLLPQYDCSKRGHKDPYYGCTSCGTPYSKKDRYNRPCCWLPEYSWICGVCNMKVPKP